MILAFFTDLRKSPSCSLFSVTKRLFIMIAAAFTLAFYFYTLVTLQKTDSIMSKWRQSKHVEEKSYAWDLFGLSEMSKTTGSLAMRTLFPFHYEMLYILALVTFSKYADVRAQLLERLEKRKLLKANMNPDKSQLAYEEALKEDGFSSSATDTANEDAPSQAERQS